MFMSLMYMCFSYANAGGAGEDSEEEEKGSEKGKYVQNFYEGRGR